MMQEVWAHLGSSTARGLHLASEPLLLGGLSPTPATPTPKAIWERGPREKWGWGAACLSTTARPQPTHSGRARHGKRCLRTKA